MAMPGTDITAPIAIARPLVAPLAETKRFSCDGQSIPRINRCGAFMDVSTRAIRRQIAVRIISEGGRVEKGFAWKRGGAENLGVK